MKMRTWATANANLLGLSESQALVLLKLLSGSDEALAAERKGPAGGPDATTYARVKFLLAVMSGAPQTQANGAAQRLYNAPVEDGLPEEKATLLEEVVPEQPPVRCRITGAVCLGDAVQHLLTSGPTYGLTLRVWQGEVAAEITSGTGETTRFGRTDWERSGVVKISSLSAQGLQTLAV